MDKFEIKKIDSANVQINAIISKKVLDDLIDKGSVSYGKTAKIEGFRAGKIPKKIIIQRYAKELLGDGKNTALRDLVSKTLVKLKVKNTDLAGEPRIIKFDETSKDDKISGDIDVSIDVFIVPNIKIDGYKDLIPPIKIPTAAPSEIKKQIQENAKNMGDLLDDSSAKSLEKDSYALFDFEGFVDGVAFDGGKAQNHSLQIGSNAFIPGFEDGMMGMSVGESRDVEVVFPKEYGEPKLAGKKAIFKTKLHKIQKKQKAKLDDALAKKILTNEKDATFKMLELKTKEQLDAQIKSKYFAEVLKPKFIEALAKKYNFDIPKISIEDEINNLLSKKAKDMSDEEIEKIKADEVKLKELRDGCKVEASKTAKIAYIIQAIIKVENISVTDNEVEHAIYHEAMYSRQDPQQMHKHYQEKGYLPIVKMNLSEQKLFSQLFDNANTQAKTKTPTKTLNKSN